jgi:Zn-dependent protease with chaperone function
MLRTPASLSEESIRHFQVDHWSLVAFFILLIFTFVFSAYIGRRRLRIAKVWSKKLTDHGGRSENEILHAVGQMMFPIRVWMGAIIVISLIGLPIIKNMTFDVMATISCILMSIYFFVHLQREQKLIFEIRKIDPKKSKANAFAFRTLFGIFLGMTFSFSVASLITAVRQSVFPIDGDAGFVIHLLEFFCLFIGLQILVSPLMVRVMLPSKKPESENELRTAKIVADAFSQLGLKSPQVRILNLDGLRFYNALIAGANRAPGPFRQIVLISQSDELSLSENETRAIIHHELAHGFLLHLPVRMVASIAIGIMGLIPIFAAALFFEKHYSLAAMPALVAGFYILIHPLIQGRLVREQEIQADEFAVARLGSSAHDLVSALSKATIASGGLLDRKPAGAWLNSNGAHPTVMEREAILQSLEQNQPQHVKRNADLSRFRVIKSMLKDGAWRSIAALNVAVVVLVFTATTLEKSKVSQNRTPASIESSLTDLQDNPPRPVKATRTESLQHVAL